MVRIAILASGSGSNTEEIIRHMKGVREIEVGCIISNNPDAGVLDRAAIYAIHTQVFKKKEWQNQKKILSFLHDRQIDFIVLAGYLQKIPDFLIQAFPRSIVNIHPALLPSYGGKGMYGMHVHRAVHENKEKESGITIHLVNEKYDDGEIIFQAKCPVLRDETPKDIQKKVQVLEHKYYPVVVKYLAGY